MQSARGMTHGEPIDPASSEPAPSPGGAPVDRGRLEPYGPQAQVIYDRLSAAAGAREFVFYDGLGEELGLDLQDPPQRSRLWDVLCEISRSEVAVGRPMLSAICVQEEDHLPGHGFFALGSELGQVSPGEDEVSFAVRQIKEVHDHWSDLPPFGETPEAR